MPLETARIGRRGTVVSPERLRHGLAEGSLVLLEEGPAGLTIRPATSSPVEIYTPAGKAEFLLSNAVDEDDYAGAVEEVRRLGPGSQRYPLLNGNS